MKYITLILGGLLLCGMAAAHADMVGPPYPFTTEGACKKRCLHACQPEWMYRFGHDPKPIGPEHWFCEAVKPELIGPDGKPTLEYNRGDNGMAYFPAPLAFDIAAKKQFGLGWGSGSKVILSTGGSGHFELSPEGELVSRGEPDAWIASFRVNPRYLGLPDFHQYLECHYSTKPIRFYRCSSGEGD